MHTLNRLLTLAICAILLAPLGTTAALVSVQDKQVAKDSLTKALDKAVVSYRNRTSLQSLQTKGERTIAEQEKRLAEINRRQRQLRADILDLRATIVQIQSRYTVKITSASGASALLAEQKQRLATALRGSYLRRLTSEQASEEIPRKLVHIALDVPGYAASADRLSDAALLHLRYVQDLSRAVQTFKRLESLTAEREKLLSERVHSEQTVEHAHELVEVTAEQMEEIKRIMEDVHDQVLKMQSELARIDARPKAKAERALIEKGLLDPQDAKNGTAKINKRPAFSWPVYGPISAGFKNASYMKHFGVPHYGMDIVVGQGTPVSSAADGVVFLVREGGAKGYTYILIGHRNGYATLYGHLSETHVKAGQDVVAGQIIGLSGGRPGTNGSGPMTTGAHLHFEVIQSGVNVDPKNVLP
jgi:murein DD-endopeptidase MepM/ murein hydrolase activator NlpD